MASVALNIITRKEDESSLLKLLDSCRDYFDEIVIVDTSINGSIDPLKTNSHTDPQVIAVIPFKWNGSFSDARNVALQYSKSDYVFWLDSDDEVRGLEYLKDYILHPDTLFLCKYEYAPGVIQWRERLFPNKPGVRWLGKIHETVVGLDKFQMVRSEDIVVTHNKDKSGYEAANKRNLAILESEYTTDGEDTDPRTLYYLARTYQGLQNWPLASEFYVRYLNKGGWPEERYDAWTFLADSLRKQGQFEPALRAGMEAIKLKPELPQAYFTLSLCYHEAGSQTDRKEYYQKAIEWADSGFHKEMPDTARVIDLANLTWKPLLVQSICYAQLGVMEKSMELARKAWDASDRKEEIEEDVRTIKELYEKDKAVEYSVFLARMIAKEDPERVARLAEAIPADIATDVRFSLVRTEYERPRVWEENEIAIFCGMSLESWADPSLIKGIGGSEEAVIYLSRELSKLGLKVTVYNHCGGLAGTYNGVTYLPYYRLNSNDTFNILISWRNLSLFRAKLQARRKYLWLHDRPVPSQFLEGEFHPIDKVIFVSQYQRSCLPDLPDSKCLVSSNGLSVALPDELPERDPHRLIWSSSYDRGIENLLERWQTIRQEIPDATLVICYGWETYLAAHGNDPQAIVWKDKIESLMSQEGITHLGRIGQRQLTTEFLKSGLWVYPTGFWEVSCITAMRAQALGAIPVVTDYAALSETVRFGFKFPGITEFLKVPDKVTDAIVDQAISLMRSEYDQESMRKQMMDDSQETFDWKHIAKQWKEDFDGAA